MSTTDIERPRFARMYIKAAERMERRGATEHRRRVLDGLNGRVLQLGAPATASTSPTTPLASAR